MLGREPSVLIVGAGMAGLMAGAALQGYGHRLALVDKGRSAGGRLATRRLGGGRADHGAQFFTVRSPEFAPWVERWRNEGLVYEWAAGWAAGPADGSADTKTGTGHPRYVVRDGMNTLAKRLAGDLTTAGASVHVGVRIQAISQVEGGWWACSDDGRVYTAEALVLTSPVPQSLELLDEGSVSLGSADRARLAAIEYAPCLAGLMVVEGETRLPETGAVQLRMGAVSWIADNHRKGLPGEATLLTVHVNPEVSRAEYDSRNDAVEALLREAVAPWLAEGAKINEVQIKRWRYALPTVLHPERFLRAEGMPPLFFAGDAFGGPRVEGAALSGLAVADELRTVLG